MRARFTIGDLARLTGATLRQLDYWATSGFLSPSVGTQLRKGWRTYSFDDVIRARAVVSLRREGVSLQTIRKVSDRIKEYSGDPLRTLKLVVYGGEVYVFPSREEAFKGISGQATFLFMDLGHIACEAEAVMQAA